MPPLPSDLISREQAAQVAEEFDPLRLSTTGREIARRIRALPPSPPAKVTVTEEALQATAKVLYRDLAISKDQARSLARAALLAAIAPETEQGQPAGGMDDPAFHEGIDFALTQLCEWFDIDPKTVSWDAATETVEGDVASVIGHIIEAKMGEDWRPAASSPAAPNGDHQSGKGGKA